MVVIAFQAYCRLFVVNYWPGILALWHWKQNKKFYIQFPVGMPDNELPILLSMLGK